MSQHSDQALFRAKIAANGDGYQKEASEALTDYTRETLRDEGIVRKILPAETITDADLDEFLDSDKPSKIFYKEVQTPLSITAPLGTLPNSVYMNFKKYRVDFARILTPNFVGDIRQINNYGPDIRAVYKEHAIKDMMTAEDVPFIEMVKAAVSPNGSPGVPGNPDMSTWVGNTPSSMTGKIQFYDFTTSSGNPIGATGFTRDTTIEALKILPRGYGNGKVATPIRNQVDKVLMNVNTLREYTKFDRTMAGGDLSQEWLKNGFTEGTIHGVKHIGTLKDDIIPDGYGFHFAAPNFLGKFLELESPTLFLETRAFMMEFFAYSMCGATLANPFGVSVIRYF
jgi:hypothetical protein